MWIIKTAQLTYITATEISQSVQQYMMYKVTTIYDAQSEQHDLFQQHVAFTT